MHRVSAAACALLVVASGCDDGTNLVDTAVLPPAVRALKVLGCDTGLRIDFANDLDPATVTAQTVFVEGSTGAVTYDPAGRSIAWLPAEPFVSGASYTAVVTNELSTTAGARLADTIRWTFACIDRVSPIVVGREPAGEGASPLTQVRVRFSELMDEATLTSETLRIHGVTSAVSWDAASRTATLTPAAPLYPGRTYAVSIAARVRDVAGNLLGADTNWSFRTRPARDDWAVRVVSPPVPSAAPCDAPIQLRLAPSFDVDETLLANEPVRIDGAPGAATTWDPVQRILQLVPRVPLRPGERYGLVATESLRDRRGDAPFDLAAAIATLDVVTSCELPTVVAVPHAWSSMPCAEGTTLQFSRPMDVTSLADAVRLQNLTRGGYDPATAPDVEIAVELDDTGLLAHVVPAEPLVDGSLYWLSVTVEAKDSNGTPLAGANAWEIGARCP